MGRAFRFWSAYINFLKLFFCTVRPGGYQKDIIWYTKFMFYYGISGGYLSGNLPAGYHRKNLLQQFLCQVKSGGGTPKITSPRPENIKQAKGKWMQSVQKYWCDLFSSSLPIWQVYFHLVMPRHVWMGQNGQTGGKTNRSSTFCTDCIHFRLACLIIFGGRFFWGCPWGLTLH